MLLLLFEAEEDDADDLNAFPCALMKFPNLPTAFSTPAPTPCTPVVYPPPPPLPPSSGGNGDAGRATPAGVTILFRASTSTYVCICIGCWCCCT